MKMFEKLSDVRAIIFQPLVTKLSLSLAISQIKLMMDQIYTYHPVSDLCVSSVQNSFTIYNSLCVGLSLLFVALFQSSPTKAVGGRQYERTTDTFGFCKILFSHFSPLMIIIMFSSNTFKMLRNSDEEFENILAQNGILH